jgi:hypothetical protein
VKGLRQPAGVARGEVRARRDGAVGKDGLFASISNIIGKIMGVEKKRPLCNAKGPSLSAVSVKSRLPGIKSRIAITRFPVLPC